MNLLLVLCVFPDEAQAVKAGRLAVEAGLAACCQAGTAVTSLYRWEGKVEQNREIPLTCKTTEDCWPALRDFLKARHPYEVPEILAVPVTAGWQGYMDWVRESCTPPAGGMPWIG